MRRPESSTGGLVGMCRDFRRPSLVPSRSGTSAVTDELRDARREANEGGLWRSNSPFPQRARPPLVGQDVSMDGYGASIVSFAEFDAARPGGRIVATSGGFDPIHPGHISSIQDSRAFGDVLVVIVNGDSFITAKKGRPFQDLETRCLIVSAIRGVDYVIPFEIENDMTVTVALRRLRPH